MLKLIDVDEPIRLRDYGAYAHLAPLVHKLRSEAELMAPALASSSCGARQQVVDRLEGRLVEDPADPRCIAPVLNEMLSEPYRRELWSRNAQRRVYNEFLVFTQLWNWLRALCRVVAD